MRHEFNAPVLFAVHDVSFIFGCFFATGLESPTHQWSCPMVPSENSSSSTDKILSNLFRVVIPFFRDFQYVLLSFIVYMSAYRRVLATATFIFASFAVLYAALFSSLLSLSMILLATFFVCMLSSISSFHHPVSLTREGRGGEGGCWSNFRGGIFFNEF